MANMTKHIQVSDEWHRRVKAYAATHGMTMPEALVDLLEIVGIDHPSLFPADKEENK